MKKLILTLAFLLVPSFAMAMEQAPTKTLTCSFTEPFFSIEIDLEGKKVTKTEPDWENDPGELITTLIAENISLTSDFSDPLLPKHQVLTKDGRPLASLTMNMNGSDGMSDITFPFEVQYDGFWGGCESDKISSVNPYE